MGKNSLTKTLAAHKASIGFVAKIIATGMMNNLNMSLHTAMSNHVGMNKENWTGYVVPYETLKVIGINCFATATSDSTPDALAKTLIGSIAVDAGITTFASMFLPSTDLGKNAVPELTKGVVLNATNAVLMGTFDWALDYALPSEEGVGEVL